MGYIVEAAKVTEVIENQGVYVDVGVEGVKGFVHVSSARITPLTFADLETLRSSCGQHFSNFQSFQGLLFSPRTNHRLQSR